MGKKNYRFSEEDLTEKLGLKRQPDGSYAKEKSNAPVAKKQYENNVLIEFIIDPIGKPRMTKRDKWLNPPRKPVLMYWNFKDAIKKAAFEQNFFLPESHFHCIFYRAMPHSWSEKKKNQMRNTPHQQKPDNDNMIKAVKDALCKEDSNIWDYRITKYWADYGKIVIKKID